MESAEGAIRDFVSEPYVILIAFLFTVGPVIFSLLRSALRALKAAREIFRTNLRSYRFRRLIRNIRQNTYIFEGWRRAKEVTIYDVSVKIEKYVLVFSFFIYSTVAISFLAIENEFDLPLMIYLYTSLFFLALFLHIYFDNQAQKDALRYSIHSGQKYKARLLKKLEKAKLAEAGRDIGETENVPD